MADIEKDFLDWVREEFEPQRGLDSSVQQLAHGIGDDAAVIDRGDYYELIGNDVLTEGNHFLAKWYSPEEIGMKAIESNVSDIFAMGGTPKYICVGLVLPKDVEIEYMKGIYKGMKRVCEKYRVQLIGGDLTSGKEMTISITAVGEVPKDRLVLRSGANKGDVVMCTGTLGASAAGLAILRFVELQGFSVGQFLDGLPENERDAFEYCLNAHFRPTACEKKARFLSEFGVTSMIDVSDGLGSEAVHLARESGLGLKLYANDIMVDDRVVLVAKRLGKNLLDWVLSGGEDFELLVTLSEDKLGELFTAAESWEFDSMHVVGKTVSPPVLGNKEVDEFRYVIVDDNGGEFEIDAGYKHF